MNLYIITKSSVKGMIFFSTVIVRYMEKNLSIIEPRYSFKFCQSLGNLIPRALSYLSLQSDGQERALGRTLGSTLVFKRKFLTQNLIVFSEFNFLEIILKRNIASCESTCTVDEVSVHLVVGVTQVERLKKLELQKLLTVGLQ